MAIRHCHCVPYAIPLLQQDRSRTSFTEGLEGRDEIKMALKCRFLSDYNLYNVTSFFSSSARLSEPLVSKVYSQMLHLRK